MGCIDMNPWYSRIDKPDRPDFVLFDLDPTPEVPWPQTDRGRADPQAPPRRARPRLVREDLRRQGLPHPRPARPALDLRRHAQLRRARRRRDRAAYPKLATTAWAKSKRRGVLIDANQNGDGQDDRLGVLGAPASGAPVSTPLDWDEVNAEARPARVHDGRRARPRGEAGDLFEGVLTTRQSLGKALRALARRVPHPANGCEGKPAAPCSTAKMPPLARRRVAAARSRGRDVEDVELRARRTRSSSGAQRVPRRSRPALRPGCTGGRPSRPRARPRCSRRRRRSDRRDAAPGSIATTCRRPEIVPRDASKSNASTRCCGVST